MGKNMSDKSVNLSSEEYRILVEQSPILIWRAGIDGNCDYFNETWLTFRGRSMAQEAGNGWAEGVYAEDYDRCLKTYLDAFGRRECFEMEYRLLRHDGVYRWIFDRGAPFYDTAGAFGGYIGSCIDVTEQIEAREMLRKAQDDEIKKLKGLLPICSYCKKIRDDKGYWQQVEVYVREHSGVDFTHGICPDCAEEYYSNFKKK
jgi:PAS domain S-box-containing protein